MIPTDSELSLVLQEFNPWWAGQPQTHLPDWERATAKPLRTWIHNRQTRRGLVLTGARQVGKTTLFRQAIRRLVRSGHPPRRVLYATFDHPILKLAGLQRTLRVWHELFPPQPEASEAEYLFLDEVQYAEGWETWLKHQVDFGPGPGRRIAVTGSASPLSVAGSESGVGRWETVPMPTLSFGEHLRLHRVPLPRLDFEHATPPSLHDLLNMTDAQRATLAHAAEELLPHFNEYLLRGGFPEPSLEPDLSRCQTLLREDVIDKVLKRDLTALYGVRRVLEAEKVFLYLCYHDGGILSPAQFARNLDGVSKQTIQNLLDLFEATHLVYRLRPTGYGKQVLRSNAKLYLADAALPGAMMLMGRRLLQEPVRLAAAVETCFFKHVYTRHYGRALGFSYWRSRGQRKLEVDLVVEMGSRMSPFEIKYQDGPIDAGKLGGLRQFMQEHDVERGYVIGRRMQDFRLLPEVAGPGQGQVLLVPAALACWCLSG